MKWFLRGLRVFYIAAISVLPVAAIADYLATQGAGTTFAALTLAAKQVPEFAACDATTAGQCAAVSAAGAVKVDGSAVTQPISGTITTNAAAGTNRVGYVSDDVCAQKAKTNLPISQNGTASVQLIALSGATVIYVCSLSLIAAAPTTVALTTGTGAACVTGNAAVIGTNTANIANSMAFPANGGMTLGSGAGTIAAGAASSELCMVLGSNVFVSGNLTYVQQ